MLALAYTNGTRPLVAALAVTVIGVLAWRMPGGSAGYLRDITAGLFALAYLPLMASFVGLMLAAPDGARRVLAFLILPVCSDVGGYAVGVLAGRHPMAPVISPSKTWEGLAGSVAACAVARRAGAHAAAARHLVAGHRAGGGGGRRGDAR